MNLSPTLNLPIEAYRKRLIYRSRSTGTKELDLWLSAFAKQCLPDMPAAELEEYERLLWVEGEVLWRWLGGAGALPEEGPVARRLRDFRPAP